MTSTISLMATTTGGIEFPLLHIIDWSATSLSLLFLGGGLVSLQAAKHPRKFAERFGGRMLRAALGFTFVYALACVLNGLAAVATGVLLTPNGTPFTGVAAYAGGIGFMALGLVLASDAGGTVRKGIPEGDVQNRGARVPTAA